MYLDVNNFLFALLQQDLQGKARPGASREKHRLPRKWKRGTPEKYQLLILMTFLFLIYLNKPHPQQLNNPNNVLIYIWSFSILYSFPGYAADMLPIWYLVFWELWCHCAINIEMCAHVSIFSKGCSKKCIEIYSFHLF